MLTLSQYAPLLTSFCPLSCLSAILYAQEHVAHTHLAFMHSNHKQIHASFVCIDLRFSHCLFAFRTKTLYNRKLHERGDAEYFLSSLRYSEVQTASRKPEGCCRLDGDWDPRKPVDHSQA